MTSSNATDDRVVKTFGINTRPPTDARSVATTRQSTVPMNGAKASRKANEITVPACRGHPARLGVEQHEGSAGLFGGLRGIASRRVLVGGAAESGGGAPPASLAWVNQSPLRQEACRPSAVPVIAPAVVTSLNAAGP